MHGLSRIKIDTYWEQSVPSYALIAPTVHRRRHLAPLTLLVFTVRHKLILAHSLTCQTKPGIVANTDSSIAQ